MNDLIALVPAKYAGYAVAVIGVASVLAPLMPPPSADNKGLRGNATYKMAYVVLHWLGQNRDKVQAAVKHEEAAK